MRTIKKNFWKPFLFGCAGLIVATVVFAVNPFYPPDPPGMPIVTDVWATGCNLNWKKPLSDGGSPVTLYHIESLDKWSNLWEKRGTVTAIYLNCTISNLVTGTQLKFRVIAENKAGPGKPSIASDPITIRNRY